MLTVFLPGIFHDFNFIYFLTLFFLGEIYSLPKKKHNNKKIRQAEDQLILISIKLFPVIIL